MKDRFFGLVVAIGLLLVVTVATYFWMSRGYGKVSPRTYEYATALYSICSRGDSERLNDLDRMVAQSADNDDISSRESRLLKSIIRQAQDEKWDKAASRVRRLMEDQVKK